MKGNYYKIIQSIHVQNIVLAIFWSMMLCALCINIFKQEINADACYYIAVSRLLNNGLVPFVDFNPGYTPLSFYIMQIPQLIVGQNFTVLLAITFLIQLINAFLIYRISFLHTQSRNLSHFASLFFIMICILWCHDYILEPFILLFGLLSLLCLFQKGKWSLFLSGFLCFCSFWSKQYGLGFIFLALAYVICKNGYSKKSITYTLLILAGFSLGILIFVGILLLQGVTLSSMVELGGGDYEKDGIRGLFEAYILLFKMIPLLVVPVICLLAKYRHTIKNPVVVISLLGVAGFMLQCYVRLYGHYLQLAIPFCCLLFIIAPLYIKNVRHRTYYKIMLVLVLLFPLRYLVPSTLSLINSNKKQNQVECALHVQNVIPSGSDSVFASQDMLYITLLNTYNPPLLRKYGLSNGFVREPEKIMDLCANAKYCIIGIEEAKNTKRFTPEVNEFLQTAFVSLPFNNLDGEIAGYVFVRK